MPMFRRGTAKPTWHELALRTAHEYVACGPDARGCDAALPSGSDQDLESSLRVPRATAKCASSLGGNDQPMWFDSSARPATLGVPSPVEAL